jgi:hypothetical protein
LVALAVKLTLPLAFALYFQLKVPDFPGLIDIEEGCGPELKLTFPVPVMVRADGVTVAFLLPIFFTFIVTVMS